MRSKTYSILQKIPQSRNLHALAGNISIAALGFLNFSLLARGLSPALFGQWAIYIMGVGLLEMIRAGLVYPALVRFVPGNAAQAREWTAAAWWLSGFFSLLISLLLFALGIFLPTHLQNEWQLFTFWLPLSFLATIPFYMGFWLLQMRRQFLKLWLLRLLFIGLFTLVAIWQLFFPQSLATIAFWQIVVHSVASVFGILLGWSELATLSQLKRQRLRSLWQMGRFTSVTALSSNLLRTMDVYLIGWWLGPAAAGLYSIPQKLIEILAIPLRSFVDNAHPQLAEAINLQQWGKVKQIFFRYVGTLTLLYLFASAGVALLAKPLVLLMGGSAYLEGVVVLQALMLYHFLMPFDRFAGITLDSLGKPQWNFAKTLFMVSVNALGDLFAIKMGWGLLGVALISSLTFSLGAAVAFGMLSPFFRRKENENSKGALG